MKRDQERERRAVLLLVATGLPALSAFLLWLEHVTHFEFLLHLAAIPLEILLGAFLVERWLARKEKEGKRRQLLYLKSYLFRSEMRQVFLSNFEALAEPAISIAEIRAATLPEAARAGCATGSARSPTARTGTWSGWSSSTPGRGTRSRSSWSGPPGTTSSRSSTT